MSAIKNITNASLKTKLIELIRLRGSMSVSDYMKIVLTNPESGFYMNNDVFGVKGHFTTSPEISQVFGEIIGVWILQEWRRFNCPRPLRLVEFGPGRGTLMMDITRSLNSFNQTHDNVHVKMIELSPHLKKMQQETLKKSPIQSIDWHTHIDEVDEDNSLSKPGGFTAYIAHEYLDALPIHKFVIDPKTKQWRELLVDYDQNQNLRFCISRVPNLSSKLLVPKNFSGTHLEVCPDAALQLEKVVKKLNSSKSGCMLVCDYGFEDDPDKVNTMGDQENTRSSQLMRSNRDTFRAFKNHELWPPLKDPGEADLTADVDFGYLKKHLNDKALIFGSVNQRDFLLRCGIQVRLNALIERAENSSQKEKLISSYKMLVEDMGLRYRLMGLYPKNSESLFQRDPPAGFSNDK